MIDYCTETAGRAAEPAFIHALGNGKICAYCCGIEIFKWFGLPYSMPAALSVEPDFSCECRTAGQYGVFTHTLSCGAQVRDFAAAGESCIIREVETPVPLHFRLRAKAGVERKALPLSSEAAWADAFRVPAGTWFYFDIYAFPTESWFFVLAEGNCERTEEGLRCLPGKSRIYLLAAQYPENIFPFIRKIFRSGVEAERERARTEDSWKGLFSSARLPVAESHPEYGRLRRCLDDVLYTVFSQTDEKGRVLAGHHFQMNYVRDMFGVAKLLGLVGLTGAAADILEAHYQVFLARGSIPNAVAPDIGVYHVHENDGAEIPSYIVLQAFDYWESGGERENMERWRPMLKACLRRTDAEIRGGTVPFNGDETYVAGGLLGREALNDGSFEATLLHIAACEKYRNYYAADAEEQKILLRAEKLRAAFLDSFRMEDGTLAVNAPDGAAARGERRGVCESCGKYGFCIENENGRYVCADCLAKGLPLADRRRYVLPAAILTDEFASNLLTEEEKGKTVARLLDNLRRTGKIPSAGKNDTTVGYEFGYFLLAAAREGDSSAEELYRRTMRLWENSGTGSWAEMYEGERPLLQHTLFRPWESCINLYASIKYANREGKE